MNKKMIVLSLVLILITTSILFYKFYKNQNVLIQDLHEIYDAIKNNHPGVYNDEDPLFNEHLENAYLIAQQSLSKKLNLEDQKQVIKQFTKSFKDTHLSLHWLNVNKKANHESPDEHFTVQKVSSDIYWITLPTFCLNAEQEKEFKVIVHDLPSLQCSDAIIFDLRKNQGGNSDYGMKIVDSLFGREYAEQQRKIVNRFVAVDWRASEDNLQYLESLSKKIDSQWLQDVVEGIKISCDQKKPYYRELSYQNSDLKLSDHVSTFVSAKIFVIIDAGNVSAALDFIDELKMMNYPIVFIGQPTKADRLYMEVRTIQLPSGLGNFCFPIKVYRNRVRKDNEPYHPDIYADTNDSSNLEKLIKSYI